MRVKCVVVCGRKAWHRRKYERFLCTFESCEGAARWRAQAWVWCVCGRKAWHRRKYERYWWRAQVWVRCVCGRKAGHWRKYERYWEGCRGRRGGACAWVSH